MARKRIFTIYDKMEDDGYFEQNPANPGARSADGRRLYNGPVEFPKMVYHPEGHYKITAPATPVVTPFGPKMVGEQRALIDKIVENAEEYAEAKAAGWHDSPAASAAKNPDRLTKAEIDLAALPNAPVVSETVLAAKDREIAELKRQLAEAE